MKMSHAWMALLAVALFALPTFANTPAPGRLMIHTNQLDGKAVSVQLYNLQQQRTTITLQDLQEETIFHSQTILKHNGFYQKFDLKNLPKGRYLLKVKQKDQEWVQVLVVKSTGIEISRAKKKSLGLARDDT